MITADNGVVRAGLVTRLLQFLYYLFCFLEGVINIVLGGERRRLSLSFDNPLRGKLEALDSSSNRRSLIVYVPTIGEFNSAKPVIALYRRQFPDDNLVLMTAYAQYLDLIAKTFPDAIVGLQNFRTPWLMKRFLQRTNPRLFIISEGPALHGYFPQRLEVALPAACFARNIPVVVTNAVLFERSLASRIDQLENAMFSQLFTQSIRFWFPPFPKFREALVREGAPVDRIRVLGDLRFDSLRISGAPKSEGLEDLLANYRASGSPILVVGSVNNISEQECVIAAWRRLRVPYPDIRLIIAPRYVNEPQVILALTAMLSAAGADFILRSNPASSQGLRDVLVVDVFGELSHYYSVATVSYIGRDHGVLEPLAYECPTIVGKGWRKKYSARPLYDYMVSEQGVICVKDETELVQVVERLIEDQPFRINCLAASRRLIAENSGASQRIMSLLEELLSHPSDPMPSQVA
jgi:3-deoxy-D-manno-octulosonic-acid transferase